MNIVIKHDIMRVLPELEQFSSRQAPFAIAKALTATAKRVQAVVTSHLPTAFDRPTAWTKRAFTVQPARKNTLTAYVFAKDSQARYLKFQVQGGGRRVKGFEKRFGANTDADTRAGATLVPTRNIKRDVSGGVSLSTIKTMQREMSSGGKTKRFFLGKPRGAGKNAGAGYGIWARIQNNRKLQAMMLFKHPPRYQRRLDLPGIGRRVVAANIAAELEAAWALAMRTAR